MVEAINIILCCIGACAVLGMIVVWLADMAKTHGDEKRARQKKLEAISAEVDIISANLSEIKRILEYR